MQVRARDVKRLVAGRYKRDNVCIYCIRVYIGE